MRRFDKTEYNAVRSVLDSTDKTLSFYSFSYLGKGGQVYAFEKEFAKWLGRKYAVAVNSGTAALFVAIKALSYDNSKIDQPTIPTYTFIADAEAVVANNLPIRFWDVDLKDYCMQECPFAFAIPVHTLGNVCNPSRFKDCSYVIEDCAQCVGGKWKGKKAGTFGDIAIFSFQGTKTITTGEGGMLAMDDKDIYEKCCAIRNHGDYYRNTPFVGYNFRMTEMQAAIGRCQLKKVGGFVKSFKKNAEMIFDLLPPGIQAPYIHRCVEHAYFILGCMWCGKTQHRDRFLAKLLLERKKRGLLFSKTAPDIPGNNQPPGYSIGAGYRKSLYDIPLYAEYRRVCPNTEYIINHAIWIDIHRWTTTKRIETEMDIFRKTYALVA